ncbi:MAG: hypothetical protein EOP56_04535 [Sphingobacteriales bacterium]|nr:MAG: hypothetical protein EOP56_04535 [Sphingobacteriales bacterium]
MRFLILLLLLVFSLGANGQSAEDGIGPRLLAIDTFLAFSERFSTEASAITPAYKLAFSDKGTPGVLKHIYKTDDNETLRFEYKYVLERRGAKVVPWVSSQRITGDGAVIAGIYNLLFGSSLTANDLGAIAVSSVEVLYKDGIRKMLLEPDDYAPGYWTLAFF